MRKKLKRHLRRWEEELSGGKRTEKYLVEMGEGSGCDTTLTVSLALAGNESKPASQGSPQGSKTISPPISAGEKLGQQGK